MFKIFQEVGLSRLVKYFIFGLWDFIFQLLPFSPLRIIWLKLGGAKLGRGCVVDKIEFTNLDRTGLHGLIMGKNVYLGNGALLDLGGKILMGDQVTVVARSIILTHHSVGFIGHPLLKYYPKMVADVKLESGSVIGVASIILPGVTVGKNAFVAGGSLVRESVPSATLVAGLPAKVKKHFA